MAQSVKAHFKTREVVDLMDLSRRQLQYWAKTGLIEPSARTPGGHHRYSFDDLVALKATKRLIDAGVSVQKIRKSVGALQDLLPQIDRPLSELVLVATGDVVLVFQENTVFEAISGQEWVFEVAAFEREVSNYRSKLQSPKRTAGSLESAAGSLESAAGALESAAGALESGAGASKSAAGASESEETGDASKTRAGQMPAKPGPRGTKKLTKDWSQTG